ncbi:retinol dehydrogenase 13-like isoform X2 [Artemia franciscana]
MRIISKFTTKWCTCKNRMDGKTVLFTGATSDLVQNAAPSRIINMGSKVHWRSTDLDMDNLNFQRGGAGYWKVYGASKLCMMLFTKELSRKLEDDGVVVKTMHP